VLAYGLGSHAIYYRFGEPPKAASGDSGPRRMRSNSIRFALPSGNCASVLRASFTSVIFEDKDDAGLVLADISLFNLSLEVKLDGVANFLRKHLLHGAGRRPGRQPADREYPGGGNIG
jgi:hypothetical protein